MLLKNDAPYFLNKVDIDAVKKHFHNKFPVKVIYPPSRIIPSKLKHNRLPDKPNSIAFDFKATVKTPTGTEVWRYYENMYIDNKGMKHYAPKKFRFSGQEFLEEGDIEKIFFLLYKCPYRFRDEDKRPKSKSDVGSPEEEKQGRIVKFMFEDLVTEAEKKAEKKQLAAKIDTLIFDPDRGLSTLKLRQVAKAMNVPNVDLLTDAQVRVHLDTRIGNRKPEIDRFLEMIDSELELSTRVDIQKVLDMDLLRYDDIKKTWYWKIEGQKGGKSLVRVTPGLNAQEALYQLYQGDDNFRQDIKAILLSGKIATAEADKVPAEE